MKLRNAPFQIVPFGPFSVEMEGVVEIYSASTHCTGSEARGYVRRTAQEREFRGWVALAGKQVAGMAFGACIGPGHWWWDDMVCGLKEDAADLEGAWTLNELGVAENWRRRGIATTLLRVVEGSLPGRMLVLSTAEVNTAARALYQSCGWEERGIIPIGAGGRRCVIFARRSETGV